MVIAAVLPIMICACPPGHRQLHDSRGSDLSPPQIGGLVQVFVHAVGRPHAARQSHASHMHSTFAPPFPTRRCPYIFPKFSQLFAVSSKVRNEHRVFYICFLQKFKKVCWLYIFLKERSVVLSLAGVPSVCWQRRIFKSHLFFSLSFWESISL
jgi:hypothetical protein